MKMIIVTTKAKIIIITIKKEANAENYLGVDHCE